MDISHRIESIHHLTLPVHDLDEAERFYVATLGASVVRRMDREAFLRIRPERVAEADSDNSPLHLAVRFVDTPEIHLFLQRGRVKPRPAPHPHLAFAVDNDALDLWIDRLRSAGVRLDGPRRLGPPGHASIYFFDPFGNLLELVTVGYRGDVTLGPPDLDAIA